MPLYQCALIEDTTTENQRARIAADITRIHCDVTGAPPSFVHAFFREVPDGKLPEGKAAFLVCGIRAGRSESDKARLISELRAAVAGQLDRREDEVLTVAAEFPASWGMEGGRILPEPGEEAEWLKAGE